MLDVIDRFAREVFGWVAFMLIVTIWGYAVYKVLSLIYRSIV